ncbi:MAG: tetratricopeptide repeat protein [Verrucomicrobia bacterium]|nr:tetratricopeptide repeat protein [Verrucomicrobiota bacterium]MCH8511418.1 tetratricopeptide repeat protein [Kiritimatiellia bacterium]
MERPHNESHQILFLASSVFLIWMVTWFMYHPVVHFDFVWDDHQFVVENPSIRDFRNVPRYFFDITTMSKPSMGREFQVFRPIRNISYLFDFHLFGLHPRGWHVHNLILHALNATLVFLLAFTLFERKDCNVRRIAALFSGLVFLLHPLQTETVAWVKSRDDLLAVLFVLSGCLVLSRPNLVRSKKGWGLLLIFHLLACLSKVQAILVLPVLAMIPPSGSYSKGEGVKRSGMLLVASLIYFVWRAVFLGQVEQTTPLAENHGQTLWVMGQVTLQYLGLFVFPRDLLADYIHMLSDPMPSFAVVLGSWITLGILFACMVLVTRMNRSYLYPFLLAGVAYAPVANLVPMMQYMAERFMYMPMVAWSLLLGVILSNVPKFSHKTFTCMAWTLAGGYLVMLGWFTTRRLPVWENNLTLFRSVVEDAPSPAFRPRKNLLSAYIDQGYLEEAQVLLEEIMERFVSDDSVNLSAQAEIWRAKAMLATLRQDMESGEILESLRQAIQLNPTYVEAYSDLGVFHATREEHNEALDAFQRALELRPFHANTLYNRGLMFFKMGQPKQGVDDLQASLEEGPRLKCYQILGAYYWNQNQIREAVRIYREGLALFPDDPVLLHWSRAGARLLGD